MMPRESVVEPSAWGASIRTPRAFEAILGQFEEALASGALRAGDRLPAERELAERFQTSRTSVREAVRALENFGVVEVRRGAEGVRICNTPREAFAELMRFHVAVGHYRRAEVAEVRGTARSWATWR
jgi:DNA-binding FadR family transcriptional regulator